jgi:ABC-2 type transport system permease protein
MMASHPTVSGPAPSPPAPLWRAILAQTVMELRLTARRSENLLVTLVVPPVLLVFFDAIEVLPTVGRRVDFLLPGALALAVIATSFVNLGIATAYERHYGVLKRLGGSPLPVGGLLAAKILAVAVVEAAGALILLAVAAGLLGWHPGTPGAVGHPSLVGTAAGATGPAGGGGMAAAVGGSLVGGAGPQPAVVLVALALGTVAFAALGLALAGTLRAEATLGLANGIFLLFLMLGGIVMPVDHLPGPLAFLAGILPAAPLSDALRIGLGNGAGDPSGDFLLLTIWAVGAALVATRAFRWE